MSVVVLAYHQMGWAALRTLLDRGVPVSAVFTYEDDPDENCWFESVAALARDAGVPVHTTTSINEPRWVEYLHGLAPDVLFSFYYRHIVRRPLLELPRLGAFNLHGSLLPKYRGRCPVNWQLVHGERESGVTLHHMVERADAGDIVGREVVAVGVDDTALDLYLKLVAAGSRVLSRHIDEILAGTAPRTPQDESQATTFGGRRPEDGRIDWTRSRREIHDLVRAVAPPWPGAFFDGPRGRVRVLRTRLGAPPPGLELAPGAIRETGPEGLGSVYAGTGDGPLELVDVEWPSLEETVRARRLEE